jgi:Icc-related predicted phosphoesterase
MKILYATDLHGRQHLYQQLAELVAAVRPEGLILGGDSLPDGEPNDSQIIQVGFVRETMRQALQGFAKAVPGLRLAIVLGNHELRCVEPALAQVADRAGMDFLRPGRVARWGRLGIVGYPCSPPTPHWAKDFERLDLPRQTTPFPNGRVWDGGLGKTVPVDAVQFLAAQPSIQEDLARIEPMEHPWMLVAHAPPARVGLDRLQNGLDVGSQAVLDFIQQRQPDISLHGHVHEAPRMSGRYWQRVGRTIAINPGQGDQTLAAVSFDSDDPAETIRAYGVEGT